jgi:hypothetical protein
MGHEGKPIGAIGLDGVGAYGGWQPFDGGSTEGLSAVGFLRVIIMLVFLPSGLSLSLRLPETSRGLGQRQPRQGWGRRLRPRDRWPGFRDEAAQGQRGLVE